MLGPCDRFTQSIYTYIYPIHPVLNEYSVANLVDLMVRAEIDRLLGQTDKYILLCTR